ncbi:MAG: S-layer homology domain-containing protein [Dysosmobacter sp.]
MRLTITARDGSGNIGRASVDVEPAGVDHKFTDTYDYWGATYVDFLYNSGVTTGYDDGTFRPDQNITRAQFAVMLYRYLGLDESEYADVTLPFADNASIPGVRRARHPGAVHRGDHQRLHRG